MADATPDSKNASTGSEDNPSQAPAKPKTKEDTLGYTKRKSKQDPIGYTQCNPIDKLKCLSLFLTE